MRRHRLAQLTFGDSQQIPNSFASTGIEARTLGVRRCDQGTLQYLQGADDSRKSQAREPRVRPPVRGVRRRASLNDFVLDPIAERADLRHVDRDDIAGL